MENPSSSKNRLWPGKGRRRGRKTRQEGSSASSLIQFHPPPTAMARLLLLLVSAVMAAAASRSKRASIGSDSWPLVRSIPADKAMRTFLETHHNNYRRKVPATNMRYLAWNWALARSAQAHADACDFQHSKGRKNVGENIWAAPFSDYSSSVRLWFDEVYDPHCQCRHVYKHCCGHYTQVVWAESRYLGCGMAECHSINTAPGHRYVLVCHYNPTGNIIRSINRQLYYLPAFKWQNETQPACSECPDDAKSCSNGLCQP